MPEVDYDIFDQNATVVSEEYIKNLHLLKSSNNNLSTELLDFLDTSEEYIPDDDIFLESSLEETAKDNPKTILMPIYNVLSPENLNIDLQSKQNKSVD